MRLTTAWGEGSDPWVPSCFAVGSATRARTGDGRSAPRLPAAPVRCCVWNGLPPPRSQPLRGLHPNSRLPIPPPHWLYQGTEMRIAPARGARRHLSASILPGRHIHPTRGASRPPPLSPAVAPPTLWLALCPRGPSPMPGWRLPRLPPLVTHPQAPRLPPAPRPAERPPRPPPHATRRPVRAPSATFAHARRHGRQPLAPVAPATPISPPSRSAPDTPSRPHAPAPPPRVTSVAARAAPIVPTRAGGFNLTPLQGERRATWGGPHHWGRSRQQWPPSWASTRPPSPFHLPATAGGGQRAGARVRPCRPSFAGRRRRRGDSPPSSASRSSFGGQRLRRAATAGPGR